MNRGRGRKDQAPGSRAPLKVAFAVAGASAAAILTLVLVVLLFVWRASRTVPERFGTPGHGRHNRWQDRVVDLGDLLPLLLLLAVLSVVFVAVIAWWSTRRANEPLERALQIQKAFVADASHELRTPLTTLNSRIQLAQHRQSQGGDVSGALEDLRADARAMDLVLSDLLVAAELAQVAGDVQSSSATRAAKAALRLMSPTAEKACVNLVLDAAPDLHVQADQTPVTRALVALLDNAIRHSPEGATVSLSVASEAPGTVNFRVSDQGPGIEGVDRDTLFARFARGNAPSSTQNFGLGLALVRDVATRFSGSVSVETSGPTGTTFRLSLPAAPSPKTQTPKTQTPKAAR